MSRFSMSARASYGDYDLAPINAIFYSPDFSRLLFFECAPATLIFDIFLFSLMILKKSSGTNRLEACFLKSGST
jgi:hypothetical protein